MMQFVILARQLASWVLALGQSATGAGQKPSERSPRATSAEPGSWSYQGLACLALFAAASLTACSANVENDGDNGRAEQAVTTAVYQINSGGGAVSPFITDQFVTGGTPSSTSKTVSTSGVANAAPAAVYQTHRYGNFAYTFGNLTASASYTVRLHFAENWWGAAGQRKFNVVINGTQVLTNLDIFATVGASKALVRDFTTSATSGGQITVQYVTVVDNAIAQGIEIYSNDAASNAPPTVATAAAANPSPVTNRTSALSVLGNDDGGEANLTYTWTTTGSPPAPVSFSANGSNTAKNTTATFSQAGSYALAVTIRDASGATTTSNVNVVVGQTLSSIDVTPATADVQVGNSQQFTASARDQFGSAMTSQPAISWSVTGGGTINSSGLFGAGNTSGGPFKISATSGSVTGNANVSVSSSSSPASTAAYQINCGGGAVSPFAADQFSTGGIASSTTKTVSTAGVSNAAPAAVYQTHRYGNFSYTLGSLTPNGSFTVRLHFAENWWSAAGQRQFNVLINGVQVATNLDIFALVGGSKALVRDFPATASSAGQITIQYVSVLDNAIAQGIEVLPSGGGTPNGAPTVSAAAAANPSPVSGKTSALSALGADDGGEGNLTYTWATVGTPPGTVTFSANGNNAAKNTTATFGQAGNYTLGVTIRDANGATATSNVTVAVNQALTTVNVTPSSAQVSTGGTQQFSASARDQFGNAMVSQPAMTWAVSGGGTINSSGLFVAGNTNGGPFTVSAKSGAVSGSGTVTVTGSGGTVSYATNFNLNESPISENGVWKHFGLDWTLVNTSNGIAFGTQTGTGGYDDSYAYLSGFYPNQSASGVIHRDAVIDGSCTHEVEILLRWSDSAHDAHGYEINLAWDGAYAEIVRWNGPVGNFTYLARGGVAGGTHEGDTLSASVVGNLITLYFNGKEVIHATDSTWTTGNPGMGFWRRACGVQGDFAFTSFTATSTAP